MLKKGTIVFYRNILQEITATPETNIHKHYVLKKINTPYYGVPRLRFTVHDFNIAIKDKELVLGPKNVLETLYA